MIRPPHGMLRVWAPSWTLLKLLFFVVPPVVKIVVVWIRIKNLMVPCAHELRLMLRKRRLLLILASITPYVLLKLLKQSLLHLVLVLHGSWRYHIAKHSCVPFWGEPLCLNAILFTVREGLLSLQHVECLRVIKFIAINVHFPTKFSEFLILIGPFIPCLLIESKLLFRRKHLPLFANQPHQLFGGQILFVVLHFLLDGFGKHHVTSHGLPSSRHWYILHPWIKFVAGMRESLPHMALGLLSEPLSVKIGFVHIRLLLLLRHLPPKLGHLAHKFHHIHVWILLLESRPHLLHVGLVRRQILFRPFKIFPIKFLFVLCPWLLRALLNGFLKSLPVILCHLLVVLFLLKR